MENSNVLTSELSYCPPRRGFLWFCRLWFFVVVAFGGFGFFGPGFANQISGDHFALWVAVQAAVLYGGLGVGIATCLAGGFYILNCVRQKRLSKAWAIILLAIVSFGSTFLTPASIHCAQKVLPWTLLEGEGWMSIAVMWFLMILISIAAFVVLAAWILLTKANRSVPGSPGSTIHG